ncbi:hypothetical protein HZS_982 [Henneguya salminicola]|nr:hypothetical protein HZS_982 [Henneguya salminicola]
MNVLKGNIGIGVLSLPYAVGQAGSLFGPIIILVAGIIVTYNMIILSESNLILLQRFKKNRLGLAGTIKYSLKPYLNEKTVNIITYVFNSFLVVYLIGSSAIYILAASEIFNNVVGDIFKDVRVWVCIFTIPILCLSIISRIGAISIISGFANTFILIGLMGVILACVLRIGIFPSVSYVSSIYTVPSCISTVVFAFEGMSSILPLINSMEDKNKLPLVLIVGNVITITAYLLVGSLGYMAYGSDINPQILLNLPENGYENIYLFRLFNVGKIIYSFGLLLSFLITVYCVHTIIMPFIVKRISFSSMEQTCVEFSIRTFIIFV